MVIFLDGLRPDQVTVLHTPNIAGIMERGVRFLSHHAVFPTETRVNVASFVTGRLPCYHGIVGNTFQVSNRGTSWDVNTGELRSLARLNKETGGRLLQTKSLGEILAENREKMISVGVGSEGNAYLHNHKAETNGGIVIHPQFTIPEDEQKEVERRVGAWPKAETPNSGRIHHATSILLDYIIPEHDPSLVTLWFSEPDSAQHKTHISSPQALRGIKLADAEIGRIVDYLRDKGLYGSTDLLVASDHGHSTVAKTIDITGQLVNAGLKGNNDSTDLHVCASGGCALLYVRNHEEAKIQAVAEYLMTQKWCGSLFSHSTIPGALPLSATHDQSSRSPDILASFSWSDELNSQGIEGTATFTKGDVPLGAGSHGSISPYEIRNLLVAEGPDFKNGFSDPTPSGIVDLLPTILHILGLTNDGALDGRVLSEALIGGQNPKDVPSESYSAWASVRREWQTFEQELRISEVNSTRYLDWGRTSIHIKSARRPRNSDGRRNS